MKKCFICSTAECSAYYGCGFLNIVAEQSLLITVIASQMAMKQIKIAGFFVRH
jgi:hypothetical protein